MNKFIISEEEKSRILEMHETATNKQYLSEQASPQPLTDVDKKTLQTFLNNIKFQCKKYLILYYLLAETQRTNNITKIVNIIS